jgi:hypothetical protein
MDTSSGAGPRLLQARTERRVEARKSSAAEDAGPTAQGMGSMKNAVSGE